MKKITLALPILLSFFLLSACAAPTNEERAEAERPEWIDHAHNQYPNNVYLTAVGEASNRTLASKNAIANLVEIFSVKVKAETKTLTEAVKQESVLGVTMESSSTLLRNIETESEQAIQGVEIKESWLSPTGKYYALAVLHRISAAQNLTESIIDLDQQTAELIDYSINVAPNSIVAVNALRTARDIQITRKMADLQLSYISGSGIPADISSEKIEQLIKQQLASLQVSVDSTSSASDVASVKAGLSRLGVTVVETSPLEISATMDMTQPAYIDAWYWLRGSYELTITENGQVISRKRWPIKVSAKQKELLAPRLQDKINSRMNEYLQQLISDSPTL
ncbi:LPP20 family lipoprotein [uncultured Psychromonas sp.]|uniref:LPP20 family lipoprotein n=1 Tax=uncultured Psychromonas sp. TaxID=173974 RepID=UPI0026096C96|nr:LPP20 family lipoprotein [uncultured Psychromonas sp.]